MPGFARRPLLLSLCFLGVFAMPGTIAAQTESQGDPVAITTAPAEAPSPDVPPAADSGAPGTPIDAPEPTEEERRPQIDILPDAGGVLTPRGVFMYENTLDYTNTSNNVFSFNGVQVAQAVLVGIINASSARQQTVTDSSRFRLGLTNRFEIDARVPYVYAQSSTTTTDATTTATTRNSIEGWGLGDVDAGLSWQLNRGMRGWPYLIANLRYKADNGKGPYDVSVDANNVIEEMPTGTGFQSVQGSMTAIKVSDPAVVFGNLGYIYNIPESVDRTFGNTRVLDVKGGDNIVASGGLGFSVNPDVSFTLGYKHSYVFPIIQSARVVATGAPLKSRTDTLQVGAFLFGMTYRFSRIVSLNLNTEVGATRDAPDVRLSLRIPVRLGKLF